MGRHQRHAWFKLSVVAAAVIAALSLSLIGGLRVGAAGFAVMGLLGLAPLFYRRRGQAAVMIDERDRLIQARASLTGFRIFWIVWVLSSVGLWAALRSREVVPVEVLPLTVLAGWALFTVIEASLTLVGYGRPE